MIPEVKELIDVLHAQVRDNGGKIVLSQSQLKILNFVDRAGNTPLLDAVADRKIETLQILIQYGADVNYLNPKTRQKAIDIAWDNAQYESMLLLLRADSTFPQDFSFDALYQDTEIPEELKLLIQNREDLHQSIKNNELESIRDFVSEETLSKFINSDNKSALEMAAQHASLPALLLLIGAQTTSLGQLTHTNNLEMINSIHSDGKSLLNIAAENGKRDIVNFLIGSGVDINHIDNHGKRPVDLAWENKHHDIVLMLFEADSELPREFDIKSLSADDIPQKNLKNFMERRDEFHFWIKEGNFEKLKTFVANCKPSKLYLNSEGKSAALTAIESRQFGIYAFIKLSGGTFKDETEKNYLEISLSVPEKDKLKQSMIPYFTSVDKSYIFYLISKSKPNKYMNKFANKLEEIFNKLAQVPEVLNILQVVQYADYLDIIFDFDNENIADINPTASKSTKGTTDYKEGRLYIAGKMDDSKILGTLAHELSHLAMQMIYENNCNPYKSDNSSLEWHFKNIVEFIKNTDDVKKTMNEFDILGKIEDSPVVVLARTYRYPEKEQPSELIVRIPHILTQFGKAADIWFRENFNIFQQLLEYYNNEVVRDCKEYVEQSFLIKPRNIVKILNQSIGEVKSILETNLSFKKCIDLDKFLSDGVGKNFLLVNTRNTWLSVLNIHQALKKLPKYSSHDSYLILKYFKYVKYREEVNKAFYLDASNLLIMECSSGTTFNSVKEHAREWIDLIRSKEDKRIIFVVNEVNTPEFKEALRGGGSDDCYNVFNDEEFSLNDLINETQEDLLSKKVMFQGMIINFNCLFDDNVNSRKLLKGDILVKLIKDEKIKIGTSLSKSSGYNESYYIWRNFDTKIVIKRKILQKRGSDIVVHSEDEFIQYCSENPDHNVHLLTTESGELIWKKSRGSISNLVKFRKEDRNSARKENNVEYFISEDDLINKSKEKKLVIISDTAGMGKSTVLTSLSIAMKKFYQNSWVLRVDLNLHTSMLEKEIKNKKSKCINFKSDDAIDFLVDKILQCNKEHDETELEKKLLKYHLLHKNNVVLLFDGFDEISPDYKDIVVELIRALLPLVKQFWVTTRPYMRLELESALETFAYTLKPLSSHEQTEFLIRYWQECNPEFVDRKRIELYARSLIDKLNQSINDKEREFTGIPLQLRMMAEVFLKKQDISDLLADILDDMGENIRPVKEGLAEFYFSANEDPIFYEKMSLVSLYKLFIYKKYCDIYEAEKKMSIISNLPTKKDIKKSYPIYIEEHQMLSLYSVFKLEQCEILLSRKDRRNVVSLMNDIINGDEKRGIIDEIINDSPHFIHRTFAEYFAADFLCTMLVDSLPDEDVQDFFFTNVLTDSAYKVIRVFLSGQLEDKEPSRKIVTKFGDRLHYLWESDHCNLSDMDQTILHISSKEGHSKIICFVRNCLVTYPSTWLELVNEKDDTDRLPIFLAVFHNNLEAVKELSIDEFDINTKNEHGDSVLHVAVRHSYTDIVEWLIKPKCEGGAGADTNARDFSDFTVLHAAVEGNNLEIVKLLVSHGSCVNSKTVDDYTVLHNAIHSQIALQTIEVLVEYGADIHVKDDEGNSVLHYAAYNSKLDVAKYLFRLGADICEKSLDNSTLLHEAAISGNKEFCEWLIKEHNLDVNAQDNSGRTPLHEAAQKDHIEIVKLLIQYNSNVLAVDLDGNTILIEASKYGSPGLLEWLVDQYNFKLTSGNINGRTLLHEATKFGNLEMVEWLLSRGLDANAKDSNGNIILTEAVKYYFLYLSKRIIRFKDKVWKKVELHKNAYMKTGDTTTHYIDLAIIQRLIEHGANIDGTDANGRTLMHYAAERNQIDIGRWLLTPKERGGGGADVTLKDCNQETPLDLAVKVGDQNMVDVIKELTTQ